MGKIKEYIIELAEAYEHFLNSTGNVEEAIEKMRKFLTKDEFEFFEAHLDIIEEMLDFTDGIEGFDSIDEASGLKGDVLRPYGGRKAREDMGYGKGGRANFDPEDELDMDDVYMEEIPGESEDDWIYDTPETHADRMSKRKSMLAKPYPMGSGGVDNVFDDDGVRIEEDFDDEEGMVPSDEIMMEPLDGDIEVERTVDEPEEFTLRAGGEELEPQTPMHYDLDFDVDMDEDPYGEGDDMYMPTMESLI